jgi:hypothetical protein
VAAIRAAWSAAKSYHVTFSTQKATLIVERRDLSGDHIPVMPEILGAEPYFLRQSGCRDD